MATTTLVAQISALATRAATEDKSIRALVGTTATAIRGEFAAADVVLNSAIVALDGKVETLDDDLRLLVDTTRTGINADFNAKIGDITTLTTTAKGNIVLAVNEVKAAVVAAKNAADALINDTTPGLDKVYSSQKTDQQIKVAVDAVVDGASDALNTLKELSAALGDDANFASSVTSSLGKRVAVDAPQTFTVGELVQGRTNLDVFSKAEVTAAIKVVSDMVGDVSSLDSVAAFEAALV